MGINNFRLWYCFLLITFLFACNTEKKFDSKVWKTKGLDWQMDDERESMLTDLINSDTLIGLDKTKVIQLLGEPEWNKKGQLEYLIQEKYGTDIDPIYIKYLWVNLDKNGIVIDCTVHK